MLSIVGGVKHCSLIFTNYYRSAYTGGIDDDVNDGASS